MRYISLFILLVAGGINQHIFAQAGRGNYVTGFSLGDLQYKSSPVGSGANKAKLKRTSVSLAPMVGKFFTTDFLAGAAIDLTFSNVKTDYEESSRIDSRNHTTGLGIELFARNFFGSANARIWPYVEARAGVGTSNSETKTGVRVNGATPAASYLTESEQHYDLPYWKLALLAGGIYKFSKQLGLDLSLGFQHTNSKAKSSYLTINSYDDGKTTRNESKSTTETGRNHIVLKVGFLIFLDKLGRQR